MFALSEAERMRFYGVVLVLALFATTLSSAIPKPADDNDDHKAKHVVDKVGDVKQCTLVANSDIILCKYLMYDIIDLVV